MERRKVVGQFCSEVLTCFQQDNAALTTIRANADDGAFSRSQDREFFHGLAQDSRSGGAERVTQRNAATIRIHALSRKGPKRHFDAGFLSLETAGLSRALMCASTWAAKASWISQISMSA